MTDTNTANSPVNDSGRERGDVASNAAEGTTMQSGTGGGTPPAWVDPGATKTHALPLIKTDPVLAHVSESIEEARMIARKLYGDHGEAASKRKVDPRHRG